MISHFEATLNSLSIHQSGNKLLDEKYKLSARPFRIEDETLSQLLLQYFLAPFEKVNELYRLSHPSNDLQLNEVYHFAEMIFNNPETLHENSEQITRHLYDVSNHPKIKSGELYVVHFTGIQLEGELFDALGIFKSESKESYLKVYPDNDGFGIQYEQEAINIKKLDKGCLVFNTEKEEGYKVAVIDHTNKGTEAVYWVDEFLKLTILNNSYNQTHNALGIYKNFVTEKLDEIYDITKAQKIDMLNRSMNYFKEKEEFDINEFSNEVIGDPKGINSFKEYKQNYEKEYETEIGDNFSISIQAIKKQARNYKSILKLDKNFHIYIHGNNELIEKGFDEKKNMNYYKVYFREEN
ncbi:MAG: nucleoid-associated protein [Bacteroidota bacterium]|nr:nucleoid-associated protein [Bacteroidota bacterium]